MKMPDEKDSAAMITMTHCLTCSLEIECPQLGAAAREAPEVTEGQREAELDLEVGEVMTRGR